MTDAPREPKHDDIPEAVASKPKRHHSLPLVWVVPLVAAVIGGWIAVKSILERGTMIAISFSTAEGLEAGKTKIKYKNVEIGEVREIKLSPERKQVVVSAAIKREAEPLLVDDSRFWVVRPRIAGGSISGLGTLVSGTYIGMDPGKSEKTRYAFAGLETPPVVTGDLPGRQFVLQGEDLGSLDIGSPVYFRRVQAGNVVAFELDRDGRGVTLRVFINAPYDRFVTRNTRFWHASGFDVSLDSSGIKLNTQSVVSILVGGIAFQAPEDEAAGEPADDDAAFALAADETHAMRTPERMSQKFVMYFEESLRGLSPGAQVDFRGVVIGEVKAIRIEYDATRKSFRFPVEVDLYPQRLGPQYESVMLQSNVTERRMQLLDSLVRQGFRAQLRSGNLLTGQLYVALDFFPKAHAVTIDWSKTPTQLPTVPGQLQELQVTLGQIAEKLDKIPFDAIGNDLRKALKSLDQTLQSTDRLMARLDKDIAPAARAAIADARRTLNAAERVLSSDAPLQQELRASLQEVNRAAQAMRILADYLERHPEALLRGKKEETP